MDDAGCSSAPDAALEEVQVCQRPRSWSCWRALPLAGPSKVRAAWQAGFCVAPEQAAAPQGLAVVPALVVGAGLEGSC